METGRTGRCSDQKRVIHLHDSAPPPQSFDGRSLAVSLIRRARRTSLAALLLTSMVASTTSAADWYVRVGGNDGAAGSAWSTAFATVQKAIDEAASGDTIRIGAGVYLPTQQTGSTTRTKTFRLFRFDELAIRGGYPANPGTEVPQDPASFETILSGDLADDDVALGNGTGENAYHVLSLIGCDADLLVDGVVIDAGNANAGSATCEDLVRDDWGGGVYTSHDFGLDESPCLGVIQNCLIRRNEATDGGGLLVNATRPCEDAVPSTYVFPAARPSSEPRK